MDKTTSNQSLLYGVIGLLLGIVLTVVVVNSQTYGMMRMMGMGGAANRMMAGHDNDYSMGMSMNYMNDELKAKTGDEFDKTFIEQMITHHQGAILMAGEAKQKANHQEIKTMADAIIAAQQKEIDEMKGWYRSWYGVDVMIEDVDPDSPMMH